MERGCGAEAVSQLHLCIRSDAQGAVQEQGMEETTPGSHCRWLLAWQGQQEFLIPPPGVCPTPEPSWPFG